MSSSHRPTEAQLRAMTTVGMDLCVDAGAGSGKTRVLVERIIHLLDKRLADLDEIVAITFTEKAALEMKERLREACRDKAPKDDPQGLSYWREIERRITHARISTIHSFCTSILREHALHQGRDPDFTMLEEAESSLMSKDVTQRVLDEMITRDDEAARSVAFEYGMRGLSAILEMMLRRRGLVEQIANDLPLEDAEALTTHMIERAGQAIAEQLRAFARSRKLQELTKALSELEGRCEDVDDLRETIRVEMIDLCTRIASSENPDEIIKCVEALSAFGFRGAKKKNWPGEGDYEAIKNAQDAVKATAQREMPPDIDEAIERKSTELVVQLYHVYAEVSAAYQEQKALAVGMDFEDLILETHGLLMSDEHVCGQVARGMKYLLIDEFQDTDNVQLRIARQLTQQGEGKRPELFVVGDAKQSIYYFRGADISVYQEVRESSGDVIHLDENFRSLPNVLSFVNDFFSSAGLFEEGGVPYAPLEGKREAQKDGRIAFLYPHLEEKTNVEDARRAEGLLIASRLADMCSGPSAVEVTDPDTHEIREANFGDVAILFRSTSSLYAYEDGLRRHGIPFNVVAGQGYYERQEISDILNLLRVLVNPLHELALCGWLRSPLVALSDESLMYLCADTSLARAFASYASLDDPEQQCRLEYARELVVELKEEALKLPLSTFLRRLIERTRAESLLLSQAHGVQKVANLRKLVSLADNFSRATSPTLREFIRYLGDVSSQSVREGDAPLRTGHSGAVTLMTIHKAKGLEFPIVVVADIARGRAGGPNKDIVGLHREVGIAAKYTDDVGESVSPASLKLLNKCREREEGNESARILYVAMTRARDWLLLSGAPKGESPGQGWFSTFNEVYGLHGMKDSATISRDDWSATVYREASAPRSMAQSSQLKVVTLGDALWKKVEALPTPAGYGASVTITELASRFSDAAIGDEDFRESDRTPLLRGQLIHRMFEAWDFEKDTEGNVTAMARYASQFESTLPDWREHVDAAAKLFAASELYEIFRKAQQIEREVPFTLSLGGQLLRGTADAVVDRRLLVDFKTGKAHSERQRQYEWQLRLYALAMQKSLGIGPDRAMLYYTDNGEMCDVDISEEMLRETQGRLTTENRRDNVEV